MGSMGIEKPITIQSEVKIFNTGALKGHSIPHEEKDMNAYVTLIESFKVTYSTSLQRQSSIVTYIVTYGGQMATLRPFRGVVDRTQNNPRNHNFFLNNATNPVQIKGGEGSEEEGKGSKCRRRAHVIQQL